jgi:hypothetical protein
MIYVTILEFGSPSLAKPLRSNNTIMHSGLEEREPAVQTANIFL